MNAPRPKSLEPSPAVSDAELARAAQRGDKRAFVEIVARHQVMVCGIALGILGDFAASEDAGQEAFLTAWRKIHELREPDRLRAWLAQISRNAALGQLRSRKGHDPLEDEPTLPDEAPGPDETVATREEAALVRECLAKIPELYRLPLVLFYRDGQSVRAVAEALGISEDAVKQRLSRGRDLCRERMSGLVENILTRSRPTAVFTMAVAVAIGALAAPATVAGAVFAASATATATTSATTASSIFSTVMTTSKTILCATAAVAVVCMPIGYRFASSGSRPASTLLANTQPVLANLPQRVPTFENSALFAEWRALHAQYGTNAQAMPALYKAIADKKDSFHRQALHAALIAEWALVNPPGGLSFFLNKSAGGNQAQQFFREWLANDPRAAVSALMSANSGWDALARECLKDIARAVPERLTEIASRLPKAESYWDSNVRDAFSAVAEGAGLDYARKSAEAVTGPNRDQALSGVARLWGKTDLDAAVAWARSFPQETNRDEIIRLALIGQASINPQSALDSISLVPGGGRQNYFATTTGARVLSEAAQTDFDGTVAWLTAHPGRLNHEDLLGLAGPVTDRLNTDPFGFLDAHATDGSLKALLPAINSALLNSASGQQASVWDWLKTQPENETTKAMRSQLMSAAAWQDPNLALQFVADIPKTSEGDQQLYQLAQGLFNGGSMLSRFDSLYAEAPERLRAPLLRNAFSVLRADNLGEPQTWVGRLSLLPESARAQGTESLARAWADQSPNEALAWTANLSAGDARKSADSAIAAVWGAKDPQAAANWVNTLPPGAERDHTTQGLVNAIAARFPQQAWDWALSISDPQEQRVATIDAARAMAAKDPATAQQRIDSAPLSAQLKTELQAALLKPTADFSTH